MTITEYKKIQRELDELAEKYKRKNITCSKYCEVYKEAILHCKSVLHRYKPKEESTTRHIR